MTDMIKADENRSNGLFEKISALIETARNVVSRSVNTMEVYTKYEIGRHIVKDEQQGKERATYGKATLKNLSSRLTEKYGSGWSVETLKKCRYFYTIYSQREIGSTPLTQSAAITSPAPSDVAPFSLSWSHYLILMRIDNSDARRFYEIEASQQQWSVRQLSRQVGSSLYERLALSRDKQEIMRLATEGQTLQQPSDIMKNPITLEFLGLRPEAAYTETRLENAIITRMRDFLLEMGKGFLFEARQKRFSFDEQNFYVDLVLYNRLLQCYVLIDLKTCKLTHQDLGQMQMYVNYYDRYVKTGFEKPTIGILLCQEKNDSLVELTLPKEANIYAAEYALYLPDKHLLQAKLQQWMKEFDDEDQPQTDKQSNEKTK